MLPPSQSPKAPKLPKRPLGSRRAGLITLGVVTALALALLVGGIALSSATRSSAPAPRQTSIGAVLAMADAHQLRSATIQGDTVTVTATDGKQYVATKEAGQPLTAYFAERGVSVSVQNADAGTPGWAQTGGEVALIALVGIFLVLMLRRNNGNGQAVPFGRTRAVRFNEQRPTVLFKDVAGVAEAKEELEEIVQFLKRPEKFEKLGARIPKGVLLVGPPGTGKTLIARAVAGEADVSFYSVSGSEFVEMFVGVGASRVRDLFKMAKENSPCIIFIDEIDAVGRQRNTTPTTGNDEREQTLNQLLVEMDGFDKKSNVVVIAATNRPDVLDPALLRPGRFDRRVMLESPDVRGRLAILQVHAEGKPIDVSISMERLASQTSGFSGADLANLMNEAALLAARRDHEVIKQDDLEESILRVMAGPERRSRIPSQAEKEIVAYHEVGHAIVMRMLPGSDPVQKVTTVARGQALGVTVTSPAEDRYLMRRTELLAKLAGLMGGRAAEEIIFGDITTGAAQDIKQATNIAQRMVREFGMSPLGNVLIGDDGVGPQLAGQVDSEIGYLVDQAYTTAKNVLTEKRDRLVAISEYLIGVETIDGEQLDAMLFARANGTTVEAQDSQPLTLEELVG